MDRTRPHRIHHIDVVVRDLDRATERYRRILGIEPRERETLPERGIILARFRIGETWLILIQPTGGDGPVARHLAEHGEGFFHMALEIDDVESRADALAAAGVRLTTTAPRLGLDGWKLVDVDVSETCGAMVQLVEEPED